MRLPGRPASWLAWGSSLSLIGVIWAIAFANLQSERREAVEAAIRENQNRAIGLGEYVRRTLEAANLGAQYLGERILADPPGSGKGERPRLLTGRIVRNPLFSSIQVTDADGDVRYTSVPDAPASNVSSRDTFKAVQEAVDTPVISRPAMSPSLYRPTFSLTRAIRRADGRFAGAVIIQMPVERLTAFNQGAKNRPLDLISVIRRDGITLARRTGAQVSYGEDLRGTLVMRQQHRAPNGTYLGPSALDGKMRYFSHRRLREFPLFVTVGVGEADVLAPVEKRTRSYLAAAAMLSAALLAVALLITLGARRRARAASALEEANRRYEKAQRIGRIGDWSYDPETRSITCSGPLCEMYERPPAENRIALDQVLAYYDRPSRDGFLRAIDAALATGEAQQCECLVQLDSGRQSIRRLVFSRILDEDGAWILTGTDQDIFQEKMHERLRDQIAHLGRVESMNVMAVTLAHELAQPLTAAANYLMLARFHASDSDPAKGEPIGDALDQADKQIGLTQEIMRRAREMLGRQGTHDAAEVRSVIDDAIALVRMANKYSGLEIRVAPVDEGWTFAANKVQIQQVVMNLVRNASEAVDGAENPLISISCSRGSDGHIVVCVEDNGPGFPHELEAGFAPFVDSRSGGLGLGLSISQAIIHSYGGTIWIDRERGQGAAICFSLPGANSPVEPLEPQAG